MPKATRAHGQTQEFTRMICLSPTSRPYITWIKDDGQVRIVAITGEIIDSAGATRRHTYKEFKKIVGRTQAKAAFERYYRELDRPAVAVKSPTP
jgi:hypothetical protein